MGGLRVFNTPEVSDAGDFKNNNSVIVIEDGGAHKDFDYLAGLPRCFNDPDGLQRPTKIDGTRQSAIELFVVLRTDFTA